jgi:hypothetical protein
MKKHTRAVIVTLALVAGLATGVGPAGASHWAPVLPVSVVPCRVDTSPTYPSCVPNLGLVSSSGSSALDIDTRIDLVCNSVDTCNFVIETCTQVLPGVREYCSTTRV